MEEFLQKLAALFINEERAYSLEEKGAARGLAAQQPDLYRRLFTAFNGVSFNDGTNSGVVGLDPEASVIFQWVSSIFQSYAAEARQIGVSFRIFSPLPVLDDNLVDDIMLFVQRGNGDLQRSEKTARMFSLTAAAALLVEVGKIGQNAEQLITISNGPYSFAFEGQMAAYAAVKSTRFLKQSLEKDASEQLSRVVSQVQNYKAEFDSLREHQRGELDLLAGSAETLRANASEIEAEITKSKERLANFEKTIREEQKLNNARRSWEIRYQEARNAFKISVGLLIFCLVLTFGSSYLWGFELIKALAALDPSTSGASESVGVAITHQIGRIIIVTVPIAVFLWMVRAVMRYFMRSMLLMDDARQRQTMLDTYFMLSEQGRADEKDRPLILWALFRQTPGHGSDGIEPPDFTQVINAGLERAKS